MRPSSENAQMRFGRGCDMRCKMFGREVASPIVVGSGPASFDADAMIALAKAGAGAVVTKTINLHAAENPTRHMVQVGMGTLINCEKWSDYPMERWLDRELPRAVDAGVPVIASIGHTWKDVAACAERIEAEGCLAIELVSYDETTVIPMLEECRRRVGLPIIVKLSPNTTDLVAHARRCVEAGADALTACDSMGPALLIDIETGAPVLGGSDGRGWLSGAQILPFTLEKVCSIRQGLADLDVPVIGLGGVTTWQAAIQMAMAGATYVGVCSAAILKGPGFVTKLDQDIDAWLSSHGYESLREITGEVLRHLPQEESPYRMTRDDATCTRCGRCVRSCPYGARSIDREGRMHVDAERCRSCGLCVSLCRSLALA